MFPMGGGIGGEAGVFPRLVLLRGGIVSFFPGCNRDPNSLLFSQILIFLRQNDPV